MDVLEIRSEDSMFIGFSKTQNKTVLGIGLVFVIYYSFFGDFTLAIKVKRERDYGFGDFWGF